MQNRQPPGDFKITRNHPVEQLKALAWEKNLGPGRAFVCNSKLWRKFLGKVGGGFKNNDSTTAGVGAPARDMEATGWPRNRA